MLLIWRSPLQMGNRAVGALLVALWLAAIPNGAAAQNKVPDFAPGFGLVYGEGRTEEDAASKRFGFTTRRLTDGGRAGTLAILFEEHNDGVPLELLDSSLSASSVELRYQSVFAELKRHFPMGANFHFYWGLRGGFTRITGKIRPGGGQPERKFESDQIAPLALLALPLAFENPGFLLLAFVDGTSFGLMFDIVPNKFWLDFQVSATLIPNYRDDFVVIDEPAIVTQTLQLALVF